MITAQLELLRLYAKLHNIHLDSAQLKHQFASCGSDGEPDPFGPGETLQALQALGFEARLETGKRQAMMATTLPALMPMRDGGLMLVGKVEGTNASVILQRAGDAEPQQVSMAEFDPLFTGQWIVASRPVATGNQHVGRNIGNAEGRGKFGIGWFWQSLKKYRSLMGEVLLASLFVQIIALVTPLIFQVVIDKVLTHRSMTVGGLIAFNMLAARVNAPILKLSSLWQDFTQMKVSIKRLADIMDAPPEPAFQPNRSTPPTVQGRITFEHMGFRYGTKSPEVLSDLNFEVTPGEVIGVVGISGAGKTTLMRLIQRLYTPDNGRILIDGVDLNLIDTSWLRRQIGVVGQDTLLFNRSVRDNIALADNSLDMEAVSNAAQLAGAHDFILQLPEGYDTVIGERGSKLSGGQRARIAIARALVTNPRLLLLDEATAALDYESERVIHDNMARITEGRTVLIVAHRLSTLRMADRIMVLDKGRLIETGQHADLMLNAGRYASLYQAHQVLELQKPAKVLEEVLV